MPRPACRGRPATLKRGQRYPMYLAQAQIRFLEAWAKGRRTSLAASAREVIDVVRWLHETRPDRLAKLLEEWLRDRA